MQNTDIGQLVLLDATFIKPNVPLVAKESGNIEKVDDSKFFSGENYLRYYILTDEVLDEGDIVYAYSRSNKDDYEITFLNQVNNREQKHIKRCYSVNNDIVGRIHKRYGQSLIKGDKQYMRFTKSFGKYAGFPPAEERRLSSEDARARWDGLFKHFLSIEPNRASKRRVGLLFGGIQNVDLTEESTMQIILKYSKWLKNQE